MFCHNCGKQIPDGVNFCRYCGTRQQSMTSGPVSAARPSAESSEYHFSYVKAKPTPPPQPTTRPQPQPQPASQPRHAAPQPQPRPQPQSTPQPQAAPGAMLTSGQCSYKVAPDADFKKFEFGGMPEGTAEIYEDRLLFFKKSKAVAAAFGMIGSALQGKGKEDIVVYRRDVRPGTATVNKTLFQFYLTDGRQAYIQFRGHGAKEAAAVMHRFLNV